MVKGTKKRKYTSEFRQSAVRLVTVEKVPVAKAAADLGMPVNTLTTDLEKAGIVKRDERGRQVDFHSFRMTFTTFLQQAGVDRRLVMEVARHKDSRLTDIVYTDAERLDLRGAINTLPDLGANAQKNSHESVPDGHLPSLPGTIARHEPHARTSNNRGKKHGVACTGTAGHDEQKNGAGGNRTPKHLRNLQKNTPIPTGAQR